MQHFVNQATESISGDTEKQLVQIRQFPPNEIDCIVGPEGDLGEGSFGTVRIGFHRGCGLIAVKCIAFRGAEKVKKKFGKRVHKEIEILQEASHENIVRVYGWTQWPYAVGIVMELLLGGNLWNVLNDDDVELSMLLRLRMCTDISSGLAFAHNLPGSRFVVHGDLKPENILLSQYLICKIADFGSAELSSYSSKSSTAEYQRELNQFTKLYAAPEVLENPSCKLRTVHDVYSFSIVVFVILVRKKPVDREPMINLYLQSVLHKNYRPSLDSIFEILAQSDDDDVKIISELMNIMQKCWERTPAERPTMVCVKKILVELSAQYNAATFLEHAAIALKDMDVKAPLPKQYECEPIHKLVGPTFNSTVLDPSLFSGSSSSSFSRSTSSRFSFARIRSSFSRTPSSSSITSSVFSFSPPLESPLDRKDESEVVVFNEFQHKVHVYDVNRHSLKTKTNLRYKHYGGTLVNYDGSCYIISGFNMRGVERSDMDDVDALWSEVAKTNQSRWHASSTVCKDWIYTVGGYGDEWQSSKSTGEKYNCDRDQWITIKNMNKARRGHALVSMRGLVFAIGGEGVNIAECYDPREGSWSVIPSPMKCKRGGMAAVALHDEIYAIGGYKCGDLATVEKYNPYSTKWQMVAELNVVRRYHGACALNGKIFVAGGGSGATLIDSAETYDPKENVWRTEASFHEFKGPLKIVSV